MKIGQLATTTGASVKTLRFYEDQGLLPEPARTPSGYRDYPEEAIARVTFIRTAQAAGLKLAQIGEILDIREQGRPPCEHVRTLVTDRLDEVEERLADLHRIRSELLAIADRLDHLEPADCITYCDAIQ